MSSNDDWKLTPVPPLTMEDLEKARKLIDNLKEEYPVGIYVSRTVMDRFVKQEPIDDHHLRPITGIPVIYNPYIMEGDYIVEYQTYGILYKKDGTQRMIPRVTIPTTSEPIKFL